MTSLQDLLPLASTEQTSDLLIIAGSPPVLRQQGLLVRVGGPRINPAEVEAMLNQMLTEDLRQRYDKTGDITFSYSVFGSGRYRVSAFRQRGTAGLAIRAIAASVPTAVQLRLPDAAIHMALASGGLVIVCGPPGSGRTTTLAALVDTVNSQRQAHVVTIESPIEYLHKHSLGLVSQREVGTDTRSYLSGLQAALDQTPDVIVLSELDSESTPLALQIALAGKLVIASLVATRIPDALATAIARLPAHQQSNARQQLASSLRGAVCQQLISRAGGAGQFAAFEVLTVGPRARELVAAGDWAGLAQLIDDGIEPGTTGMRQALVTLAATGEISESEYLARTAALEVSTS
jgi:twitching motility protein PilT